MRIAYVDRQILAILCWLDQQAWQEPLVANNLVEDRLQNRGRRNESDDALRRARDRVAPIADDTWGPVARHQAKPEWTVDRQPFSGFANAVLDRARCEHDAAGRSVGLEEPVDGSGVGARC